MLESFPRSPGNKSSLGRLLEEISWCDVPLRRFRDGGQGLENVLTTEVFQALDFLPRSLFLGPLLRTCHGAGATCARLADEAEEATVTVLPGNAYLRPSANDHAQAGGVQPDVLLQSPGVYGLVEAKRPRGAFSFQPEQLAREYCLTRRDAAERLPLLLLVIPQEPPVPVQGQGRRPIEQAIAEALGSTLSQMEDFSPDPASIQQGIAETVAWMTWAEVKGCIIQRLGELTLQPESVDRAIRRVARSAVNAIEWHSESGRP